uniref:Uncharacterized protein n=1 Tax=Utricularia reniformis TaxID=192314 RepID=A0A1Y0AZ57_9LAMI|nr:hypothetical protein AEK19_MT2005 [Utricularia reniformis]ART30424.1 hypothetical protein AEK19_MT2005 [Utricularia reniformis]
MREQLNNQVYCYCLGINNEKKSLDELKSVRKNHSLILLLTASPSTRTPLAIYRKLTVRLDYMNLLSLITSLEQSTFTTRLRRHKWQSVLLRL